MNHVFKNYNHSKTTNCIFAFKRKQVIHHQHRIFPVAVSAQHAQSMSRKKYPFSYLPNQEQTNDEAIHSKRYFLSILSFGAILFGFALKRKHQVECKSEPDNATELDTNGIDDCKDEKKISLQEAIRLGRDLSQRIKDETGCPGVTVAVCVDGKEVWAEGLGYADVENRVHCHADSVIRIASISKPIAMTIVAKLWENGKLDLDKPIQHYVPSWPEKTFQGKKVTITTRQLLSHISGVRNYDKNCGRKPKPQQSKDTKAKDSPNDNSLTAEASANQTTKRELDLKEFFNKERYNSVTEALNIFKDDELCELPGTKYLYSTYGYTLISAVVEGASGRKFPDLVKELFKELRMENSFLDENDPLIYNRARHYLKNKKGRLVNAPYVDLSCKWAGGGFISTARDVCTFGNAMLYSFQNRQDTSTPSQQTKPGYLKPETMDMIWSPVKLAKCDWDADGYYGMGWGVVTPGGQKHGQCREVRQYFGHTGGAVGASSTFVILPRQQTNKSGEGLEIPQGVVVTMIGNTSSVGFNKTALKIAQIFENVE